MVRWARASGVALLGSQASGSFAPSLSEGEGLPGLSRGRLNRLNAVDDDAMACPSFDINITTPIPGMRLIGMEVPIKVR
jgi:hypothetical protein